MYKERIRDIYEHLSPGYRRIADFLLKQYQDAAFMTAAEVARASDVDTTLVVRFAQRLGYPGFPEMIADVQDDVKRDLKAVYERIEDDNTAVGVLRRNLTQDRNNIEYMLLHMNAEIVQKAVDLLYKANRIFVIGEGNTSFIGEAFATRLTVLGHNAHIVPSEPAGQASVVTTLGPNDVVMAFGTSLMTPTVASMLKISRAAGAKTIGIVGSMTNPAAAVAETVIVAPTATSGMMPSWTAIAAVAHGLTQAVASLHGEPSADWALRTQRLLDTYEEFWHNRVDMIKDAIADYNVRPSSK
jgi:DNA-binding MurR/RpiR family transcriptional regulator